MQDAQPELKRIQKQYKDNKEEMNKKVAEYYKENGINPAQVLLIDNSDKNGNISVA